MTADIARTRIGSVRLKDGFQNFEAALGLGTNNQMSSSRYGLNPLTRNRIELDFMYRGSWVVRKAVGVPADDMTRAGIELHGMGEDCDPVRLQNSLRRLNVWGSLAKGVKWGRLYGGALNVIMIEGQNLNEPLRPETVAKGQFKGLLPIDRWSLSPSTTKVDTLGPDFGKPLGYSVVSGDSDGVPGSWIHHTRVVRHEGEDLPYYQRQSEMGWGMSIVEAFHDRLVAFDSATLGAAQLVYKAHLRTLKMKDLRKNIASGGKDYAAALMQVDLIRRYQSLEGLTLLDAEDDFKTDSYAFAGLDGVTMQLTQQLAGALDMPLVKFFGMSPAGFSTGESDLRSYNDNIGLKQERDLRHPLEIITDVSYRSEFGEAPPAEFGFRFAPLYGLNAIEKANIAASVSTAVAAAEASAPDAFTPSMVLKELKRSSETTGIFSSITDADIDKAIEAETIAPEIEPPEPEAEPESGTQAISDPGSRDPRAQMAELAALAEKKPFPFGRPQAVRAA